MPFPLIVATCFIAFVIFFPLIAYVSYVIEIFGYRLGNKVNEFIDIED